METDKLKFGGRKYAAYNLLVAKWMSLQECPLGDFNYITMGGTELYDVANFWWASGGSEQQFHSFEEQPHRFILAKQRADEYKSHGVNVHVVNDDLFDYQRSSENTHIFFVDLEGVCGMPYCTAFQKWFTESILQPGDLLIITSYLGRNPGWTRVLAPFDTEFRMLKVANHEDRKHLYEAMHPAFVLYRALRYSGLHTDLNLQCIGHVRYRDKSPMGIYGFICADGETKFSELMHGVPCFNTIRKDWSVSL
jgi:hypothetical protein